MAMTIMERLATKVAMEANAAMSRRRSVIVVSRVPLCFYFVLILFESQQENKKRITDRESWLRSRSETAEDTMPPWRSRLIFSPGLTGGKVSAGTRRVPRIEIDK
ncbi:hypothetical protein ACFFP0_19600 [Rhizobium puerariae]|uniref:Uncharacterized protein n=1 Tax=Rhizobium puerariae TaxID=1585791 RepID=A0ABV6AMW4_9HYPH